jgi:hypothetical protein
MLGPEAAFCDMGATTGYEGEDCKTCAPGYYRLEDKCTACPSGAYMLIVVYAGAIGEVPLANRVPQAPHHASYVCAAATTCQVVSLASSLRSGLVCACIHMSRRRGRPHGVRPVQRRESERAGHRRRLPAGRRPALLRSVCL